MGKRVTRDQIAAILRAKWSSTIGVDPCADAILAVFEPSQQADEELGRCVDDLESTGRENAGLKREIARLKEQLDFVIDPARATAAQHTIKAMAGERDELREEIARLEADLKSAREQVDALSRKAYEEQSVADALRNQIIAFNTQNVHDSQEIARQKARVGELEDQTKRDTRHFSVAGDQRVIDLVSQVEASERNHGETAKLLAEVTRDRIALRAQLAEAERVIGEVQLQVERTALYVHNAGPETHGDAYTFFSECSAVACKAARAALALTPASVRERGEAERRVIEAAQAFDNEDAMREAAKRIYDQVRRSGDWDSREPFIKQFMWQVRALFEPTADALTALTPPREGAK